MNHQRPRWLRSMSKLFVITCIVAVLLPSVLVVGCAGGGPTPQTTPAASALDKAEKAYFDLGLIYEQAQGAVVAARSLGKVSNADWQRFDALQHQVATMQPALRGLLDRWRSTGQQPAEFTTTNDQFSSAVHAVTTLKEQVK